MRSSPLNISALDSPSCVEREFVDFLRETQSRDLRLCIWLGLCLWLALVGWDVGRYVLSIQGSAMEAGFAQSVLPARLATLLALCGLLIGVRYHLWGAWQHVAYLLTVAVYCIADFVAGYFYNAMAVNDGMAASILILMALFFPSGLRLRETLLAASLLVGAYWLAGWWFLLPQQWTEFRNTSALLTVCIAMLAFGSYLRERGAREQFLRYRLLAAQAGHDPLTGLPNRRSLENYFEICLAQARREDKALLLVILDLDHFKLYNDHYGHKAGDRALQQVALLLEHYAARPMDLVIRLSGAEFGLLNYGDDAQALKLRMQHLLEQLQGLQISHERSPTASCLSASIGIAQAEATDTVDSLFEQAYAQLNRAQSTGYNRICGL